MRGRVEVPGRDVGIPILFVPRILSRESETRTLNSTSTDYQKKLQLFRYMVPQNLSCHAGASTMIDFVRLFLFRHHVCESLNDTFDHVCETPSWNFSCSQHLEIKHATVRAKISCFIWIDEYLYHCRRVVPASLKLIPQDSIQDRSELSGVHAKWTAK
jgi:hypothetical protein